MSTQKPRAQVRPAPRGTASPRLRGNTIATAPRLRRTAIAAAVATTLAGSVALHAGGASAQAPVAADVAARDVSAPLPTVFVTAQRMPQPFQTLLADVTVIDAEEIARSGASSFADLMQRQPGIEITQNGGRGATSGLFLRGTNTGHVLVLVDGLRVSSSTSGATAIEAIPLDAIDHIEILRGPASSLYGSDAIGGVVQVFTRKGSDGLHANANAGYGRYDTWDGGAGVSGGGDNWRAALQVTGARSDGFNAIVNPGNFSYDPDRDGFESYGVTANGGFDWAKGQALSAQYYRSTMNAQYDGGDGFDDRTKTTLESYGITSVNALAPWWTSRLTIGEGSDRSVSETGFGNYPFRTRQRQYAWQNELDARSALPLAGLTRALATIGVERREERVDGDTAFDVSSRDTNAVFGAWQMGAGPHSLQANLRHDDSSQFGNRNTGAVAYGYAFSPAWRATASYGTAFKAPTFNDLYYPGYSNPGLAPERSRNVEGGLYWNGSARTPGAAADADAVRLDASAVAYYNKVRDLILFVCDADFNCAPQNLERAKITGVTLSASGAWRQSSLRASLDLARPENDDNGNLLPRRARSHASIAFAQELGPVRLGAEVVASSHRFDDAANTVRLGGYGMLNLTAEWTVARGVTLFLRGDNVFDRDYQLVADYSTGGARWFGGVRWAM